MMYGKGLPQPSFACGECSHRMGQHDRLPEVGDDRTPRFRCTEKNCYCGQQYEPIISQLSADASEADVEAEMLRMGREHDRRREAAAIRRLARSL